MPRPSPEQKNNDTNNTHENDIPFTPFRKEQNTSSDPIKEQKFQEIIQGFETLLNQTNIDFNQNLDNILKDLETSLTGNSNETA